MTSVSLWCPCPPICAGPKAHGWPQTLSRFPRLAAARPPLPLTAAGDVLGKLPPAPRYSTLGFSQTPAFCIFISRAVTAFPLLELQGCSWAQTRDPWGWHKL